MAIYHLHASNVSRRAGSSAVATASYITGKTLIDERTGETYNYGRKQRVLDYGVVLAESMPIEWSSPSALMNQIEMADTAKDSKPAKKFEVALPVELSEADQRTLLFNFIRDNFTEHHYGCVWAIHVDKDGTNPHAHIEVANRPYENGKWQPKNKTCYATDEHGEKIPIIDKKTKKQKIGTNGSPQWRRIKEEHYLGKRETLKEIRAAWARSVNEKLSEIGSQERVDHRSYADQGLSIIPTKHVGYEELRLMEADPGYIGPITAENERIRLYNAEIVRQEQQKEIVDHPVDLETNNDLAAQDQQTVDGSSVAMQPEHVQDLQDDPLTVNSTNQEISEQVQAVAVDIQALAAKIEPQQATRIARELGPVLQRVFGPLHTYASRYAPTRNDTDGIHQSFTDGQDILLGDDGCWQTTASSQSRKWFSYANYIVQYDPAYRAIDSRIERLVTLIRDVDPERLANLAEEMKDAPVAKRETKRSEAKKNIETRPAQGTSPFRLPDAASVKSRERKPVPYRNTRGTQRPDTTKSGRRQSCVPRQKTSTDVFAGISTKRTNGSMRQPDHTAAAIAKERNRNEGWGQKLIAECRSIVEQLTARVDYLTAQIKDLFIGGKGNSGRATERVADTGEFRPEESAHTEMHELLTDGQAQRGEQELARREQRLERSEPTLHGRESTVAVTVRDLLSRSRFARGVADVVESVLTAIRDRRRDRARVVPDTDRTSAGSGNNHRVGVPQQQEQAQSAHDTRLTAADIDPCLSYELQVRLIDSVSLLSFAKAHGSAVKRSLLHHGMVQNVRSVRTLQQEKITFHYWKELDRWYYLDADGRKRFIADYAYNYLPEYKDSSRAEVIIDLAYKWIPEQINIAKKVVEQRAASDAERKAESDRQIDVTRNELSQQQAETCILRGQEGNRRLKERYLSPEQRLAQATAQAARAKVEEQARQQAAEQEEAAIRAREQQACETTDALKKAEEVLQETYRLQWKQAQQTAVKQLEAGFLEPLVRAAIEYDVSGENLLAISAQSQIRKEPIIRNDDSSYGYPLPYDRDPIKLPAAAFLMVRLLPKVMETDPTNVLVHDLADCMLRVAGGSDHAPKDLARRLAEHPDDLPEIVHSARMQALQACEIYREREEREHEVQQHEYYKKEKNQSWDWER